MNVLRSISMILIAALATGCAAWRPIAPDQMAATIEEHPSARIRVQLEDERWELRNPVLHGDTLSGLRIDLQRPRKAAVAMAHVRSMDHMRSGKTARTVAVGAIVVLMILIPLVGWRTSFNP